MNAKLRHVTAILVLIAAAGGRYLYWRAQTGSQLPDGVVAANGRIAAEQVELATKRAGRLSEGLIAAGDLVHLGDVVS
jgi:HlyD family secretion protein